MANLDTIFKKILTSPYAGPLKTRSHDVLVDPDGRVHISGGGGRHGCWQLQRENPRAAAGPTTKVLLKDVLHAYETEKVCPACQYSFGSPYGNSLVSDALSQAILDLDGANTRLKSMLKVTKSTSAAAVQKRILEVPDQVRSLKAHQNANVRQAGLVAALEELITQFEDAKEVLKGHANSDSAREKLEIKVKEQMVPKRFHGQGLGLDDTLHLVGISPVPGGYGSKNQVKAVLDAYAIRQDKVAVLVAPAYMYSYLLQQLYPKPQYTTLVVSAPAPESVELRELIAGIWDPEGEGALACMQAAITAATALQVT